MKTYFKIRSWHITRTISRAGWYIGFCGKVAVPVHGDLLSDELPGDEKSCESCLKIARRNQDKANA